jgi:hypothetical protein
VSRRQADLTLSIDVLLLISAVLNIYRALGGLSVSRDQAAAWLRQPPRDLRPPLEILASGTLDGTSAALRFLQATCQGLYMAPNKVDFGFEPYVDDEIIIR